MAMALKNNLFLMSSDDFKEAIAAFVEKRPPKYKGQ
jgi:enoyl-CoA hydratase/carnithine racemase